MGKIVQHWWNNKESVSLVVQESIMRCSLPQLHGLFHHEYDKLVLSLGESLAGLEE